MGRDTRSTNGSAEISAIHPGVSSRRDAIDIPRGFRESSLAGVKYFRPSNVHTPFMLRHD